MNRSNKRASFELSFGMIFSIIAGAVIIFIAIYAATRFIGTSQAVSYTAAAVAISNLMDPIANGITSAYASSVSFNRETRIYLNCSTLTGLSPYFGAESISFSEKSGFANRWSVPGLEISRYNKYIFADSIEQGKKLSIFAVPFNLGYQVDNLIFLSAEDYCFVAPPSFIGEQIDDLSIANINTTSKVDQCSRNSVRVCFGFNSLGCNISVEGSCTDAYCKSQYDSGRVLKNGINTYYISNLIYAAIFSSPEIYECNIARLGKKAAELGAVYKDEIEIVRIRQCNSVIGPYLDNIITISSNLTASKLANAEYQARLMDEQNCQSDCKIYRPSAGACFS